MFKWLRENVFAAGLLLLLRLYVGWEWMTAGWHKLTADKAFDAAGFLKGAIANPIKDHATNEMIYPTYVAFLKHFALPNVKLFNVIIPLGEFLVGLGLLLGVLTTAAAFFGLLMNFMFLFAGTVSTNPWLVLLGGIIFVAGANAGKFGADYYLFPYLKNRFHRKGKGGTTNKHSGTKHTPAHI